MDELRSLIERHSGSDSLDGVRLAATTTTTSPIGAIAEPSLAIVAGGEKQTVVNERVYSYGPGQYLIVSLGLPVTAHISQAPFVGVGFTLRPAAIAALLLETAPETPAPTPAGIGVSDAGPELLDAVVRLLRLLDRPGDARALAPVYEREILWRLLTGEHGAMVRQIGLADSALSAISRAIDWIRSHHAETLRIDQLARLSGMSASSFHRHFRAATAMTPLQFQKQIRLQEARARLLGGPENVARVGFDVGYNSPSQFSREYRRAFGVPPSRDAELLRA